MITIIDRQIYYNGVAMTVWKIEGNIVHLLDAENEGYCVEATDEELEEIINL